VKQANEILKIPNVDSYTRLANLALGALLIAMVFNVSGNLGWLTLLPISAVYPMFVAITGYSPHRALLSLVVSKIRDMDEADGNQEAEYYRLVLH
jgi:hypothetical protein